MARAEGTIQVDGWDELRRNMRRAADRDLPKRMGQANKKTGAFIKSIVERESSADAVGEGTGASVRPSASKREVLLRVGGAHRAAHSPKKQWGKKVVRPFRHAPPRPYIKRITERHLDEIGDFFLKAQAEAFSSVFHDTEP